MRTNINIQKRVVAKDRYVYTATIPTKILKKLGWKEGDTLNPKVLGNILAFEKLR